MTTTVVLDGCALRPEHVADIAAGARVRLGGEARARMAASAEAWAALPSVLVQKRRFLVGADAPDEDLVPSFILGHCCGVGEPLPDGVVRALVACRANVLAVGASGVRPAAVDALLALLDADVLPVVPSQGSVGAAGDLAPLAHVARVVCGLGGDVRLPDGRVGTSPLPAFVPTAKEALALINGATLTAALAAIAVHRAGRLLDAVELGCAMSMELLRADPRALDLDALALRGHPGAVDTAARIAALRGHPREVREPDAFSLRAAPAVIGAARDALRWVTQTVTRELNGACDNPLWVGGRVVETGNFHGAPVALAMDTLRIAMTSVAAQSERRTFRMSAAHVSGDLPSFLVRSSGLNSGFMLAQYTAASLVSECKGLAHPASVDSIPTVQHQEDHVSMGPIAGRLTLRVLEAVADVAAIEILLAAQGLEFRREGRAVVAGQLADVPTVALPPAVEAARRGVRARVPRWDDDDLMYPALRAAGALVRDGALTGGGAAW